MEANKNFRLSYPVWSVTWTGKEIAKLSGEKIVEQLDLMQKIGISELMLTGYHEEEPANFNMDEETRKVGNLLRERGMKGAQHHSLTSMWTTPGESQKEVVRRMRKCVDYTANLNTDVVVFHAMKFLGGTDAGSDIKARLEDAVRKTSEAAVMETLCSNLHEAGEYAKERGVLIAVENLDGFTPWCNQEYLPRIVNGADSEAVGFCLDTGHAWCGGYDPAGWVGIMGRKLFTTHVHDNHGRPAESVIEEAKKNFVSLTLDEHLPPGFGTISWTAFILELWKHGYNRTLNFESNGWEGLDKEEGYRCAVNFWRTCEFLADKKQKKEAVK